MTVAIIPFLAAHRLPAPIQETETPTPGPSAAPTAAVPSTPLAQPPLPPPSPPSVPPNNTTGGARYAGTWIGQINMEKLGDIEVTLVINTDGTSVHQSSRLAAANLPIFYNDKMLWWKSGAKKEIPWTFTANPDGQTAAVTRTFAGRTTSATFRRISAATILKATPAAAGKKGGRK